MGIVPDACLSTRFEVYPKRRYVRTTKKQAPIVGQLAMSEIASQQPYLRRLFDGETYELKNGSTIIGRSEDCDLVFDEPGLSRKHVRITVDNERIILFDLGSLNGTLVNSREALSKLSLDHGDIIIFDEFEYELLLPHAETNKSTPTAQIETVVANRHEREREDLIKSEVRMVDTAFLARDTASDRDAEQTPISSINQPTFVIRGVGAAGIRIALDMSREEWTLGSSNTHDISIAHPSVASNHAKLRLDAGLWLLSASNSNEVLQINGQTTQGMAISSGDVIRIGDIDCLFVCPREFSAGHNRPEQHGGATHQPLQTQTFDTTDMTPVAWRKNHREPSPKRRSRVWITIVALLILLTIMVGYFYWQNSN